jgi:DNA-3-methyladenine glycosylase
MRLSMGFFDRDVLQVAPDLIGKKLVRKNNEALASYIITEAEAYRGIEDEASHARFGKTSRNRVMFGSAGTVYVYLIYGMYWMLNIVTGSNGQPQAVLIRGLDGFDGPGKLARELGIDRSFYGEDLTISRRLWIENCTEKSGIIQKPRQGIDYAHEPWKSMPWRFIRVQPPGIF